MKIILYLFFLSVTFYCSLTKTFKSNNHYCTYSDSTELFNRLPSFLLSANDNQLSNYFMDSSFCRFSSTINGKLIIDYDKAYGIMMDDTTIKTISQRIIFFKKSLILSQTEIPIVEYMQWADFTERTEIWPSGLVVVFRNNKLSHIWLDYKS
jgi:hypothetical protein